MISWSTWTRRMTRIEILSSLRFLTLIPSIGGALLYNGLRRIQNLQSKVPGEPFGIRFFYATLAPDSQVTFGTPPLLVCFVLCLRLQVKLLSHFCRLVVALPCTERPLFAEAAMSAHLSHDDLFGRNRRHQPPFNSTQHFFSCERLDLKRVLRHRRAPGRARLGEMDLRHIKAQDH